MTLLLAGATKCWGEALARTFSTSHGLSCICVRLGGFPADINPGGGEIAPDAHESVSNAVSYEDAAQVFGKCVDVRAAAPFASSFEASKKRHLCTGG